MATIIGSTNNSLWTYKLEVSESVPSDASTSNVSSVTVDMYIGRASSRSYIGGSWTGSVTVDGNTNSVSGTIPYPTYIDGGAWYQIGSTTFSSIRHNDDGSKTVAVSAAMSSSAFTPSYCSASGNVTLYTIPRYFSQIPKMEQIGRTTKTVTIKWTTSENASQSQYSIDDASHWKNVETNINKSTGTMTIGGLTAGKSYRIYGDFKRKDSGLWCQTKPYVDVATFDYAKISSAPNFNDEGNPKITYTNPMGSAVTTLQACIASTDGQTIYVDYRNINKTGTLSYTFNLTEAERNSLRTATTGKKRQVNFYIKTVADNTTYYSYKEVTFEIVNGNPTFTDFAYADTNTTVSNLIGTNQALVQGKSNLQVTISSANKMVAIKQASPKNYTASIDNKTIPANYSTNNVVIDMGTISSSGTQRLTVTAYDSRDNFTPRYKDITIYEYKKPVVNATVERLNNFEDQTTLSITGEYTKLVIEEDAKNTILNGTYKYRETGGTWTSELPLSITINDNMFSCDDVILSLDNSKSFEFELAITDRLDTTTLTLTLDIGKAIFFISTNLQKCFVNNDLDVNGVAMVGELHPKNKIAVSDAIETKTNAQYGTLSLENNGIKATLIADATSTTYGYYSSMNYSLRGLEGKTLTFSYKPINNFSASGRYGRVELYYATRSGERDDGIGIANTDNPKITFTVPNTLTQWNERLQLTFLVQSEYCLSGNYVIFDDIQLEEGTSVTDYHKHRGFGFVQGQNDDGSYIKYDDGSLICYAKKTVMFSFNSNQKWGSMWESDATSLGLFPHAFYETPVVNVTNNSGSGGFIEGLLETTTTNIGKMYMCRPLDTNTTIEYTLSIIAIGRWK